MKRHEMDEEFPKLEMRLLDPDVRSSPEQLEALLASDFLEFGSSGRTFDKREIVAALSRESRFEASVRDFHTRPLGADVVLTTYRLVVHPEKGKVRQSNRSSIWVRRSGQWQMLFHQGTAVK